MGDDSDAQLEQRVDQLEQQLSKMLPGRRGVLKGLGAAALGGAAVGASTGGASGQSAAGQVGTESAPVDVRGAQGNFDSVNTADLSVTEGHGLLGLPNHHINYSSGLTSEEVARFSLTAGDVLELWRLECSLKAGGTNSNVTLDVYDVTNATVLGSVTAGSRAEGDSTPLGTSGAGATILIRVSTGNSSVDLCGTGVTSVVSQ